MNTDTLTRIDESGVLTERMRFHQAEITELGKQRRKLWYDLWTSGISQARIAEMNGVTTQCVYMEIKRQKKENLTQ